MSNLTKDTIFPSRGSDVRSRKVTDAVQLYGGSLVGYNPSTGLAVKWADTAGFLFLGQALRAVLGTAVAPLPEVGYSVGGILQNVNVTGVSAITSQGAKVYCATDNPEDLTLTPTTNTKAIGTIDRWRTAARCDVLLFTPEQHAAQVLIADIVTLTDSSGLSGTHDDTIAAMAAIVTLTDSTGDSGTHDDTLAAVTLPTAITGDGAATLGAANGAFEDQNDAVTATDGTTPGAAALKTDVDARLVSIGNNMQELATAQTANLAAITVLRQNESDLAQKVIELVAREQIAAQNISDLTQKVIEILARLNAQQ